jgi:hypothetical protein
MLALEPCPTCKHRHDRDVAGVPVPRCGFVKIDGQRVLACNCVFHRPAATRIAPLDDEPSDYGYFNPFGY